MLGHISIRGQKVENPMKLRKGISEAGKNTQMSSVLKIK
jgi:hypothetical protein